MKFNGYDLDDVFDKEKRRSQTELDKAKQELARLNERYEFNKKQKQLYEKDIKLDPPERAEYIMHHEKQMEELLIRIGVTQMIIEDLEEQ